MPILFKRPSVLVGARSISSRCLSFNYWARRIVPLNSTDEGAVVDADAQAFLTATGITDPTQQTAIFDLVAALKSAGIWDKCTAIYPCIGGTAATHKYNLKDAQDLDSSFRLVFTGGFTHNANGITPDGTTSHADTKIVPATHLTNNNTHVAVYSRTTAATNGFCVGVTDTTISSTDIVLIPRTTTNFHSLDMYTTGAGTGRLSVANSDGSGFHIGSRRASNDIEAYRNGVSLGSGTGVSPQPLTNIDIPIYLFANNNNGASVSSRTNYNIAFASIGLGLTDQEAADYYTAVLAFQTALSRNV